MGDYPHLLSSNAELGHYRIGEALALQAGDIDLQQRQATVKRTWSLRGATGNDRFNSPKSGKERVVDLTP